MEIILTIAGLLIAAGLGFYFGRNFSHNAQQQSRLETELNEKQQELDAFRNKVNNHFEKTADLFNQVSDSYQSLYDHMANSSNQLCATPTFQSLPQSSKVNDSVESATQTSTPKTDQNTDKIFNADNLYNAHDYRNQASDNNTEHEEELTSDSRKIVDIESAKEDKKAPALDYAVKEEGIINHNSLDIDGVKTS